MTMEKISSWSGQYKPEVKQMSEMVAGEVCFIDDSRAGVNDGEYVIMLHHIGEAKLVLLLNSDNGDTYSSKCHLEVRTLYPNENVAVKFS